MPTYEYRCPTHGHREIRKPAVEAGRDEYCVPCSEAAHQLVPLRRVYGVPGLIIRPHGFHLRPGDRGYWDIDRALEVGHVPTPDAHSNLGAGAPQDDAPEDDTPTIALDPQAERKLHEALTATYGEPGDADAARVWHEARTNGYGKETA